MSFWEIAKQRSIETKQRRHMAKLNQCLNPSVEVSDKEFQTRFAGDLKIATSNPALIKKRIKEETEAKQQKELDRRAKFIVRKD